MAKRSRLNSHALHKWIGLFAALWLAVLGLTGFILDHRDWTWVWQTSVNSDWLPASLVEKSQTSQYRIFQVNPSDNRRLITGGATGLWWSADRGLHWQKTNFGSAAQPGVHAVQERLPAPGSNQPRWRSLWLATSDGLWLSTDEGRSATPVALDGQRITALSYDAGSDALIGVEDRSRLFRYTPATGRVDWLPVAPPTDLSTAIDLSRLVRDLHFGRGLITPSFDLLWSDITGLAMVVLALSGFLFYWLPKRWKKHKVRGSHKKRVIRNLYRMHAIFAGVVVAVPVLYLSVTGIILDHAEALRPWLKETSVPVSLQPPTYHNESWDQLIYGVAVIPTVPPQLVLGSRAGLFVSVDEGQSWSKEPSVNGFVWTLRQQGSQVMLGGMGAPNRILTGRGWELAYGSGHMPTDMSADAAGGIYWKSGHGLMKTSSASPPKHIEVPYPKTGGTPLYYVLDGLHTGLLIHPAWPWLNDVFAICAIVLVITGLRRWWRHRWL